MQEQKRLVYTDYWKSARGDGKYSYPSGVDIEKLIDDIWIQLMFYGRVEIVLPVVEKVEVVESE